jgi:hypothetical protein
MTILRLVYAENEARSGGFLSTHISRDITRHPSSMGIDESGRR